jgi:hypothetical protein
VVHGKRVRPGLPWLGDRRNHFDNGKTTVSYTEHFDHHSRIVTDQRGEDYGHPRDDFIRAELIRQAIKDCPNPAVRHALAMIGVKMARLVHNPYHKDSMVDIAGYARTIAMIADRDQEIINDAQRM